MVITMSRHYLLVIGDRAALAWVLAEQRMAFPALRRSQAMALEIGDELLVYTTRGCFRNPGRDRGRVMGLAKVTTHVVTWPSPLSSASAVTRRDARLTFRAWQHCTKASS